MARRHRVDGVELTGTATSRWARRRGGRCARRTRLCAGQFGRDLARRIGRGTGVSEYPERNSGLPRFRYSVRRGSFRRYRCASKPWPSSPCSECSVPPGSRMRFRPRPPGRCPVSHSTPSFRRYSGVRGPAHRGGPAHREGPRCVPARRVPFHVPARGGPNVCPSPAGPVPCPGPGGPNMCPGPWGPVPCPGQPGFPGP